MTTDRDTLSQSFNALLQPEQFKDYGPNGLQVEGKAQIKKIVSGVTASLALIEAAIAAKADAIVVHHGLFWRGQDGRVTGWMKQRLQALLAANVNLYGFHLPLDAHSQLGNNAQLGKLWGFKAYKGAAGRCGDQGLVWLGERAKKGTNGHLGGSFANAQALAAHVEKLTQRAAVVVQATPRKIKKIAWCSGGAQDYFEAAIAAGADAFITGEISEPQAHYARECGVAYLACGHHATERYGVQAVAGHVAAKLGLAHEFIDIDNPA